jgi:ribonucleoside-triphosphate reductase
MYDLGFVELSKQYATLGINGLYECCKELGYDYRKPEDRQFVKELLQHINKLNDTIGEEMNHIVNVEQIPAENVAVKLAKIDKTLGLNDKYDIYANQFIPLDITTDGGILDRISIQGELDEYFSGGSILHINLDQECNDEDLFLNLGKYAIESGVRYFGINYATNHCHNCGGTFVGKLEKCPHCQSTDFETWCRTVGYMVPVENYNKVRRQEFERRVFYKEHSIQITE